MARSRKAAQVLAQQSILGVGVTALCGEDEITCGIGEILHSEDRAMIGHHDRLSQWNTSWNSSHSTAGCSLEDFRSTGGAGRFYCFAAE